MRAIVAAASWFFGMTQTICTIRFLSVATDRLVAVSPSVRSKTIREAGASPIVSAVL